MADSIKMNVPQVKMVSYILPSAVTINANSTHSITLSDLGLPSGAWILGGFVSSYSDANADGLVVNRSVWFSTNNVTIINAKSSAVTLSAGRTIYVYYV